MAGVMCKKLLFILSFLCLALVGNTQVTKVKYKILYDTVLCNYDVWLHIVEGNATNLVHRTQANSSIILVLPTGSTLDPNQKIDTIYAPFINNNPVGNTTGPSTRMWDVSASILAPTADPLHDFHQITTVGLSPVSRYNNLAQGDSVRLFGLKITLPVSYNKCFEDVRIFKNWYEPGFPVVFPTWSPGSMDADPDSGAPGLGGANLNNGFTFLGSGQIYTGAITTPAPEHNIKLKQLCNEGLNIDVNEIQVPQCLRPLTFSWTGPGSYNVTTKTVSIPPSSNPQGGTYSLTVKDKIGCTETFDITVDPTPNAGNDTIACSGQALTLHAISPNTGVWSDLSNNPPATVTAGAGGSATINFPPTAAGTYKFLYTAGSCADTIDVQIASIDAGSNPDPQLCFTNATVTLNAVPLVGGMWKLSSTTPAGLSANITNSNLANTSATGFTGKGSYVFSWVKGNCKDEITVLIDDDCGCPIANNIIDPVNQTFCVSSGFVTIQGSQATPAGGTYTWQKSSDGSTWVNADGTNSNKNYTTQNLGVGVHFFRRRYAIASCDHLSNEITIIVNPNPSIGGPYADITCFDPALGPQGSITMNADGAGKWTQLSGPSAFIENENSGTTTIRDFSAVGNYTFEWNVDGCKATTIIKVLSKPNAGPDKNLDCVNLAQSNTIVMTGSGIGTWSQVGGPTVSIGGGNTPSPSITGFSQPGEYLFTYGDASCFDEAKITVTEKPTAQIISQDVLCVTLPGGTVEVNAISSSSGYWSLSSGPIGGSFTPDDAISTSTTLRKFNVQGTYIVRWTTDEGCNSNLIPITVTAVQLAGSDKITPCIALPGGSITMDAQGSSGQWTKISGGSASISPINSPNASVSNFNTPGLHEFVWSVNGCTDTVAIEVKANPNAGPDQTISCFDLGQGSVIMNANPNPLDGTAFWSEMGNPGSWQMSDINDGTTDVHSLGAPGIYTFIWNVDGCKDEVRVTAVPKADAGGDKNLQCVSFPSSVTIQAIQPNVGSGSWSKSNVNPTPNPLIDTPGNALTDVSNIRAEGYYEYIWSTIYLGVTCRDTMSVTVIEKPKAGNDINAFCKDVASLTLNLNAQGNGTWQNTSGGFIVNPGSATSTVNNFPGAGTYEYIWESNNCTDTVKVNITAKAKAGLDPQPVICFSGGFAFLNALDASGTWKQIAGSTSQIEYPNNAVTKVFGFTQPGTYLYEWATTDCKDTVSVVVGNDCVCSIANNTITGGAEYCSQSPAVSIAGTAATPTNGTYKWEVSANNASFIAAPNGTNQNFTTPLLGVGEYHYRRLYTNNQGFICTDTSNEVIIIVKAKPNAGGDQQLPCIQLPGGSISVIASGTVGNWSALDGGSITSLTTNTTSFNNFQTEGINRFVWTVNGCGDTLNVSVTKATNAGPDQITPCVDMSGYTATLAAQGSGTWTKNSSDPNTNIASSTNASTTVSGFPSAGIYKYIWTSSNLCTDEVQIEVKQKANAGSDANLVCVDDVTTASATLNAIGTGSWTALNGGTILNSGNATTVVNNFATTGNYIFEWKNSSSCLDTASVFVSQGADAGPDINYNCYSSISFTLTGNGIAGTWSQMAGNPSQVDMTNPSLPNCVVSNFVAKGIYKFVWKIGSCTDTVSIVLGDDCPCTVANNNIQQPSPNTYCGTVNNVVISGQDATPIGGAYTWIKSTNGVNFTVVSGATTKDLNTGSLAEGNYTYHRIYTDNSSGFTCRDTSLPVNIIVNQRPNAGPDQVLNCIDLPGGNLKTNATGVGTWIVPSGVSIADPNEPITTIFGFPNAGTYLIQYANNGCIDSMTVAVSQKANAGVDKNYDCVALNTLNINMSAIGTGSWRALGTPASSTIFTASNANTSITSFSTGGVYRYEWSNAACKDTVEISITEKANAGSGGTVSCVDLPGGSFNLNGVGSIGNWRVISGGSLSFENQTKGSTKILDFNNEGLYELEWTNAAQCRDTVQINVTAKPDAGTNPTTVNCYLTGSTVVTSTTDGIWVMDNSTPGKSYSIGTPNAKSTVIDGFTQKGDYKIFREDNNGCRDTLFFFVSDAGCNCPIGNNLVNPINGNFCGNSGPLKILGTVALPSNGIYKWQQKIDNGSFVDLGGFGNDVDLDLPAGLNKGSYSFRRIYKTTTNPICEDTSNLVSIVINEKPKAGRDIDASCFDFTNDVINMDADDVGIWKQIGGLDVDIKLIDDPKTTVSNFKQEGVYIFELTSNGCKDSVAVNITSKVNAGPDVTLTCVDFPGGTASINATGNGSWRVLGSNTNLPSITNNGLANTTVTDFKTDGVFQLEWASPNGCADTMSIVVSANVNAGLPTATVECFTTDNAILSALTPGGTWALSNGPNGATANIVTPGSQVTSVDNFTKKGDYTFEYSLGLCKDFVIVTVNENCSSCGIVNNILPPSPNHCGVLQNFEIKADAASPAGGTYLWQISKNNANFVDASDDNNNINYLILSLTSGEYRFRRIYSVPSCEPDTSNIVALGIRSSDAGTNIVSNCEFSYPASIKLGAAGAGKWTQVAGPSSVNFADANDATSIVNNINASGKYKFEWVSLGCVDTVELNITQKADAGLNQTEECYMAHVAILTAKGTGSWSLLSNNGPLSFEAGKAITEVSGFSTDGTYTFEWKNEDNCTDQVDVVLGKACACPITNTISSTILPTCDSTGTFIVNGNDATPIGGSYEWQIKRNTDSFTKVDGNATTKDYTFASLPIGNYRVFRIYNEPALGCIDTSNVVSITVNASPDLGQDKSLPCITLPGGNVSLNNTSGGNWKKITTNANASINTLGQNTNISNFEKEGTYRFEFDKAGCKDTIEITVTEKPNAGNASTVACYQTGRASLAASPTQNGKWKFISNISIAGGSVSIQDEDVANTSVDNFSKSGNYYFEWSNGSCSDTVLIQALANCNSGCAIDQNNIISQNSTTCPQTLPTIIDGSKAEPTGGNYQWQIQNASGLYVNINTNGTSEDFNAGVLTVGTYKYRRIYSLSANCADTTAAVTIKVNAKPAAASLSGNGPLCEGDTILIKATSVAGAKYIWSGPQGNINDNGNSIAINNAGLNHIGTYKLVLEQNGCLSDTASFMMEIKARPAKPSIDFSSPICEGDTILMSTTDLGVQYQWTGPSFTSNEQKVEITNAKVTNSGQYKLVVTQNGCESKPTSINIVVNGKPQAPVLNQNGPICAGEQLILQTATESNTKYVWTKNGVVIPATGNKIQITNAKMEDAGKYELKIEKGGCKSDKSNLDVVIFQTPIVSAPDSIQCIKTDSIKLTADMDGGVWFAESSNPGTSLMGAGKNPIIKNFSAVGEYTYRYEITATGCSQSVSFMVSENCPCVIAENTIIQPNPAVYCESIDGLILTGTEVDNDDLIYRWVVNKNNTGYENAPGINTNKDYRIDNIGVGDYQFRRYVKNNNLIGCIDTGGVINLKIIDKDSLGIKIGDFKNPSCIGDTITLNVINTIKGIPYKWNISEGIKLLSNNNSEKIQVTGIDAGQRSIGISIEAQGCQNAKPDVIDIEILENPTINLGNDTTYCSIDGEITLSALGYDSVLWEDGSDDEQYIINKKGIYSVIVTDTLGCRARDEIAIKEFCCKVYFPNIIDLSSVNNSEFQIKETECIVKSKLRIFDRWGNLVYVSEEGLKPWDGKFNGKDVEQGVYVFIFEYTALDADNNEINEKLSGDVTVVRR